VVIYRLPSTRKQLLALPVESALEGGAVTRRGNDSLRALKAAAERNPEFGYELMKRVTQVVLQRLQAAR